VNLGHLDMVGLRVILVTSGLAARYHSMEL